MNGIMPGPLWLAIASAANDSAIENRNPTHELKNDTVTGNMPGSQKNIIGGEWKAHGDFEKKLHPVEHTMDRKELGHGEPGGVGSGGIRTRSIAARARSTVVCFDLRREKAVTTEPTCPQKHQ